MMIFISIRINYTIDL